MCYLTLKLSLFILFLSCFVLQAYAQGIIGVPPNLNLGNENQGTPSLIIKPEILVQIKPEIQVVKEKRERNFLAYSNRKIVTFRNTTDEQQIKNEKEFLRQEWEKFLGIDVFMPYFKVKEIEDWVSEKAAVHIYKIKGKPKFEDNQIKYTFKVRF
jgi:hypothetical protein